MRLCILGNSHLAAFKLGWEDAKAEWPGWTADFFGATRGQMKSLRVQDGSLVPTSVKVKESFLNVSGGLDRIKGDYDAYILVGMGYSFALLMAILATHRTPDCYDPEGEHQLVSHAFVERSIPSALNKSAAIANISRLKEISSAPIIFSPAPYPAKALLEHPKYLYWNLAAQRERMLAAYKREFSTIECTAVEQPENTIEDRYFTRAEYSRGSIRLKGHMNAAHADDDHHHMNADFGAACLRDILSNHLNTQSAAA